MNRLCFDSMVRALVVSLAMLSGCTERNCTAVGCGPSGYRLGSEPWPAGDYEIAITYDSVEVSCALRIEAAAASGDDDAGGLEDEPLADCTQTTGGTLSVWASDRATLEMYDSPASFELSVKREGRVLFEETVTPDYDASEINGPGCGVCRIASETIDVGDLR